jgi:hypothetical protein
MEQDKVAKLLDRELDAAVYHKDYDAVKKALDKGANPNRPEEYTSFLALVVQDPGPHKETERIVRLLIERGADPNNNSDNPSALPLFKAAITLKRKTEDKEGYNYTDEEGETYMRVIDTLCELTTPENIELLNIYYPGLLPESCLAKASSARVEPAMKALERQTNKSYGAPPGTYDVPPGFSESVGEYAFGIKTPRPTGAGKRKQKRKTNKRRKNTKRRRTLKK